MSALAIRGWCPGAYRPMASGDGLVVRVRPPLGGLIPEQARGLADLADRFGTGRVALTNRANLQIRGVEATAHNALIEGLAALELLDRDANAEGRRNIILDPFHSLAPDDLQAEVARRLAAALSRPEFTGLPPKFGFVVDAGPKRRLAEASGDIRIEAAGSEFVARADRCEAGRRAATAAEASSLALQLARWFLSSDGVGADGRGRMARHLAAGATLPQHLQGNLPPNHAVPTAQPGRMADGILIAAAFGELATGDLRLLANCGAPVLRITPWRMIFLPGMVETVWMEAAPGLIICPDNPLLHVSACIGAPGCAQASVETRAVARSLAPRISAGSKLHVSGCAKGCAHPAVSDLTLVGRDGRFDLVRHGAPWDDPDCCGLEPTALNDLIRG